MALVTNPYDQPMPRPRVALTRELTGLIRARRTNLRITQARAAELAGISPTWWRRIEGGNKPKGDAEVQTVVNMLAALGTAGDELVEIGELRLSHLVERKRQGEPDSKSLLAVMLESLSPDEVNSVVAFIEVLRRLSDDRRTTQRDA